MRKNNYHQELNKYSNDLWKRFLNSIKNISEDSLINFTPKIGKYLRKERIICKHVLTVSEISIKNQDEIYI